MINSVHSTVCFQVQWLSTSLVDMGAWTAIGHYDRRYDRRYDSYNRGCASLAWSLMIIIIIHNQDDQYNHESGVG